MGHIHKDVTFDPKLVSVPVKNGQTTLLSLAYEKYW